MPDRIRRLARRGLDDAVRLGELRLGSSLGFVVLHRCGESFYFLLVSTWQNDNELWETVWAKDGEDDPEFHPWPLEGTHRPTFCVWELGAVAHERLAWSAYLLSERDDARGTATSATSSRAWCERACAESASDGGGRLEGGVSRTTGLALTVWRRGSAGGSLTSCRQGGFG